MKASYKEDDCEVLNLSYKQLFKLNANLIEEHDKIENYNLYLKYYIEFLRNNNETLRYEMSNLRNQASKCETCVSMKKEVEDLQETLSKFTKGK